MEYIAIRENQGLKQAREKGLLTERHQGQAYGAEIPEEITPEFVRAKIGKIKPKAIGCSFFSIDIKGDSRVLVLLRGIKNENKIPVSVA